MKFPLPALAALLFSTGFALADVNKNLSDLSILQSPTLSAEEMKQIRFTAKVDAEASFPLEVQLHNPFRDKSIRGLVVSVQWKTAAGQDQALDVFVDLACGPLQSSYNESEFINAREVARLSPVVTLKEVHREAQAKPPAAARPKEVPDEIRILRTPVFTPEELKQIPFSWYFQDTQYLQIELHNPFRDKFIHGAVVRVQWKTAEGKEEAIDVSEENLICHPLKSSGATVHFYKLYEAAKGSPVVTLKELHRDE